MSLHIIILAAGKGTRMYSKLPKVLHQIGGKFMLEHVIDTAATLQPESINVVIGHGKDLVLQQLSHKQVNWVEQTEQLGTGHAVKMALPHISQNGKTLVLYGDVPLINKENLTNLLAQAGEGVGILTDIMGNPTGYGRIIRNAQNQVTAIVEEKDANAEQKTINEVNTGIFVLPNAHLANWLNALQSNNAQGEYYLTDVVGLAVRDNVAVTPHPVSAHYLAAGVNNKLQLGELANIYRNHRAAEVMLAGVTLLDSFSFHLRGSLKHGQDVIIDANCILEGEVELGDDVRIGANCVIKNAKIAAGTVIAPFSHLEDCVIGENAQIGPFARLRPNAVLADEVHIGNFVEVKNSTIGKGSKANHLTYLGDTTIGTKTNIGAGTITCNYDGVNKHKTVIGDEVRIGSHTSLVAPVTVGNKVTTGAGSVITKNCEDGKLVVARAKQVTIEGWVRPEKPAKK
ncbi:bifunctional UDP-N-acetylglucosamine diphosphorylase/glucosamine-1-phosphate N-acetyltransferase GlmU [Kingella negevensis]|uniref:bifunctional UDP-N-acetylglucosamine diphosphorylase/glucosamine-1-phosphate N-acetyltransferase GlmU n=1 Tax=Kingella negevensis TaxID=1522312 RepID=UPI002549C201|nr:bifunctional UDP-N-acetylglucosamine diphosphorylase/glucosamine-1-phosphate N-acetyltransferase GlmU [Kingella negevensis]MDK4679297.1 bifunctional UDP-N-acetylglucosamine diphosphorylase/glucosamine-1-phosphate N-acetyltransferase GlmU [Kingella negevensis]MDK4682981.1 bifunctional UDP-N-acetylglucosamine diphosphorylase/glucosamine-1-phosphate N-acetyltransferase GlmU [Kingella negevensis]MDK4691181.1 bifunctional UDP-N-acetylglucosamine diphosphorylase/glucosamine-1-phosphate N-acetyltran